MPEPPTIDIDSGYNPFSSEEKLRKANVVERFEREKASKWEMLYTTSLEKDTAPEESEIVPDSLRKIFQIRNKYIVCPVISGLMIIDQKRAHERILYERYLQILNEKSQASQKTLFPEKVELNPADLFVIKEIESDLRILGLDIRDLGNNFVSISSIPAGTENIDPKEMLGIFLSEFKNKQADPSSGVKEKVASALARSSAIPYGKVLARSEMEDLFDTLFACSAPNYSPSGKPVINIITLDELDKRFK
jgi:DNA mismatch repair protein MutL